MSTSTYTSTFVRTYAQTATHLSGVLVSGLVETLLAIGVSHDRVAPVYGYDKVLSAWIEEKSLRSLQVTLTSPGSTEKAAYSFDFDYTTFDPEREFRDQLARIRRQVAKEPRVRTGTEFEVIAGPRPGWSLSSQPGWGSLSRTPPSFEGGYRHGTAASGPGASAVFRSHRI